MNYIWEQLTVPETKGWLWQRMNKKSQILMRKRLQCWSGNLRSSSGITDTIIKETTKKEELQIPKPTMSATNVEVPNTSSKNALNGRTRRVKGKQGKQEDNQQKETSTKRTFAKP